MDREQRKGIEIDLCGTCRSIWLDGGELAALMKKLPPRSTKVRGSRHSGFGFGDLIDGLLWLGLPWW
jgi:Zn-finger nucleic acid-binding protein